jgi:hypothetical protein
MEKGTIDFFELFNEQIAMALQNTTRPQRIGACLDNFRIHLLSVVCIH